MAASIESTITAIPTSLLGGKESPFFFEGTQKPPKQHPLHNALSEGLAPMKFEREQCSGCFLPIEDQVYLSTDGEFWHECCLKCFTCSINLSDQASCFFKHGKVYCRKDYFQEVLSTSRCNRCDVPIKPTELILKAKNFPYHVKCFTCLTCNQIFKPGDQIAFQNNQIFCLSHFPNLPKKEMESSAFHNIKPMQQSVAAPTNCINNQITPQEATVKTSSQDDQNANVLKTISSTPEPTTATTFHTSVTNNITQPTPPPPPPPPHLSHMPVSPMPHPPSLMAIPTNPLPTHYPAFDFLKMIPAACHLPNSGGTPKGRIRKKKHLDDHSLLPYTAAGILEAESGLQSGLFGLDPRHHHRHHHHMSGYMTGPGGLGLNDTSGRSKRMRTSFKHNQLQAMKQYFNANHNPDAKDLKSLAQKTGLTKRVLQVWFQNARAKFRRNLMREQIQGPNGKSDKSLNPLNDSSDPIDSGTSERILCSDLLRKTSAEILDLDESYSDDVADDDDDESLMSYSPGSSTESGGGNGTHHGNEDDEDL